MFKKEEWLVLGVFVLSVFLFVSFNNEGITNITGFAVSDPELDVALTKTQFIPGDVLQGFLNITFTGPFDPSTKIKAEFNSASYQSILKDYFSSKNISFTETPSSLSLLEPADSKTITFDAAGSKTVAFKLPKYANVDSFSMTPTGDAASPPSFVSLDVEEYTNRKEWKYLGDFVSFGQDFVYPSGLNVNSAGDPVTLGVNTTYFCEPVALPESKQFKLGAKLKKVADGADVKAVLLSFDGDVSASGGADFCDLPEPGTTSDWQTCDLAFATTKQGIYLVCVYYEGDSEKQYYEISRDSDTGVRYDCPIVESGSTTCLKSTSKDYFIGVKSANYSGTLNKALSWSDGVTDQDVKDSLTGFLGSCSADSIGDCIVPVTVSSESAGTLKLSGLRIDYTEEGGASSYSTKFYDLTQVPGMIVSVGGVSLENASKTVQISLVEFNLTTPNITKVSDTLYLEVSLIPGGKVSKPVKIYSGGYVPDTSTVEGKLTNANKMISDMKSSHGEELDFFGIQLDTTKLSSFQTEVNSIEADANLSMEESSAKLDKLAGQIDAYLQSQSKDFYLDSSFKDLYVADPGSVEKVVLEGADEAYFYQSNVEVSVGVSNYILEKYDGSKEKYVVIKKEIIPQKSLSNVYVYEVIPKTVASNVASVIFKDKSYEVIEQDPVVRYTFTSLSQPTTIAYGVKGLAVTQSMLSGLGSLVVPLKKEEVEEKESTCGDGVCTRPYEDEIVCPGDCLGKAKIPWTLIIALVVLLVIGVVYINFFKGKGAFRMLMGRSPFSKPEDLENIKGYIKAAKDKGVKNQEISGALLKKGWTKDQIVYAFEDLKWDEKRMFTINVAPSGKDNVKKLKTFIKKCLQLNIPINKVRNVLIQKGWPAVKIDEVLAEVGKPEDKIETEKEKQKKVSYYFEKELVKEAKK